MPPRVRISTTRWCGFSGPIAIDDVIAAYVDNADAEPAVLAAIEAVDAADLGDEDAEFTVGDAQDHDLPGTRQEAAVPARCSLLRGIR